MKKCFVSSLHNDMFFCFCNNVLTIFFYRYTILENIFFEFEKIISEHLVQVRFSPLMTLPTTVKITAQDFETKLAWSALPGSIISVPAGQAMNHLFFSQKTFRRRVFQKTVGVYHIMHINKHHSTHIVSIRIPSIRTVSIRIHSIRIQFHSIHIHSIGMHQQESHRFAFATSTQGIFHRDFFNVIPTISRDQKQFEP